MRPDSYRHFLFWEFQTGPWWGRPGIQIGRSRSMGLVLLIIIWLITLVSTYFFVAKWWWLPVGASAAAAGIDHHFTVSFILMGPVFVAPQLPLGWFAGKGRAFKGDVVSGVMVVPVNREVEVILRAHDVIHSFFVPQMRFKQDAVPGLAIHMHFTPIQTGEYEIACAELCGLGHYKMHGILKVVSQEEFDKWLAAREAEKQ